MSCRFSLSSSGSPWAMLFGLALEKAKCHGAVGFLIGQFQITNFTMLKVMLTAIATGLVILAALNGLGIVQLSVKAAMIGNMVVGGLLLGVGIVFAGACPGHGARADRRRLQGCLGR